MSFVTRIRVWRARRKERKAEQLIALATEPKKYTPIQGQVDMANAGVFEDPGIQRHAGEEGKTHL